MVKKCRPSQYTLDSIPARLLKHISNIGGPHILTLINTCLGSGCVPTAFKHAIVQPLIKKHNLDPSVLSSFKPISKLPFLSKVLEKGVLEQVQLHLDLNGITEKFQSGLISRHSIATALLKIFNDLLLSVDSGSPAALRLLDFTAAFYTVDHQIILSRLELCVDITGNVLK